MSCASGVSISVSFSVSISISDRGECGSDLLSLYRTSFSPCRRWKLSESQSKQCIGASSSGYSRYCSNTLHTRQSTERLTEHLLANVKKLLKLLLFISGATGAIASKTVLWPSVTKRCLTFPASSSASQSADRQKVRRKNNERKKMMSWLSGLLNQAPIKIINHVVPWKSLPAVLWLLPVWTPVGRTIAAEVTIIEKQQAHT